MYGQALTDLFVGHASSNRPRVSEQRTVEGTSLPSAHPSLRKFHAARQLLGPSRAFHRRGRSCNSLPPPPPIPLRLSPTAALSATGDLTVIRATQRTRPLPAAVKESLY